MSFRVARRVLVEVRGQQVDARLAELDGGERGQGDLRLAADRARPKLDALSIVGSLRACLVMDKCLKGVYMLIARS